MSSLEKGALVSWLLSPVCSDLTTPITMTFQDTATFQDTVAKRSFCQLPGGKQAAFTKGGTSLGSYRDTGS